MAARSGMMIRANSLSMLNLGLSTWKPPSPPMAIFSGFLAESASSSTTGTCGQQMHEAIQATPQGGGPDRARAARRDHQRTLCHLSRR